MKVIFEIKDKTLQLASSLLMASADDEKEESLIETAMQNVKSLEEPIEFKPGDFDGDKELKEQMGQLNLAFAMFVLGKEIQKLES